MTINSPITSTIPTRLRLGSGIFAVPFLVLSLLAALYMAASPAHGDTSTLERERERRSAQALEAQQELLRGDRAYEAGNYEEAVAAYAAARGLLGPAAPTNALWKASTERYAQASVEQARHLAKTGSREEAHALLDTVLKADVAPGYSGATQLKAQIDDPLHYNPALTPEHVIDVDKVRRLLYEAEGFASLGRYGQSLAFYEEVLRHDPTNTAARRGMEAVHQQVALYSDAASDETRATMLAAVDEAWEIKVNPNDFEANLNPDLEGGMGPGGRSAEEKLRSIIVPQVELEGVNLSEAIEYLRQVSASLDLITLDPEQRGVSFVVDLGTGESDVAKRISTTRFDLKLHNVPIGKILKYINEATGTTTRVDEYAVTIRAVGVTDTDLVTRSFRVPPDFLSREAIGEQAADDDPFAPEKGGNQGLLPQRLSPKEFLKSKGVSFPEGASASLNARTSTLQVTNTRMNVDFVEQVVAAITEKEPVVVVVEVRIINTSQELLEELGYDWITSGGHLNGGLYPNGGTPGNGTAIADFTAPGFDGVTSGLRSGEATSSDDTVDTLIKSGFANNDQEGARAPGIISLVGAWDSGTVGVMLRGLDQHKGIDQMFKKTVVTRSGQKAVIESVIEMIVPTEYEPPQVSIASGGAAVDLITGEAAAASTTFATPSTPTAFETRKLGCMLEVEPLVGPNRQYVELSLQPTVRRFDGFIDYGTPINGGNSSFGINFGGIGVPGVPTFNRSSNFGELTANSILMPVFSVIRSNSNLTIADGETVVMGGLLEDHHLKYEDKVPILGDLPLVGRFFRSESESSDRNALVIMVTVRLVDPSGHPYRGR
jgi:general secretion pathway protein D